MKMTARIWNTDGTLKKDLTSIGISFYGHNPVFIDQELFMDLEELLFMGFQKMFEGCSSQFSFDLVPRVGVDLNVVPIGTNIEGSGDVFSIFGVPRVPKCDVYGYRKYGHHKGHEHGLGQAKVLRKDSIEQEVIKPTYYDQVANHPKQLFSQSPVHNRFGS